MVSSMVGMHKLRIGSKKTWDAAALPEHACAAMLVRSRVFLQGVSWSLQLVNEIWIEDVELVALHDLNT